MLDTFKEIIAVIVAVIGVLTTIYKLGFKNNHSRTKEYYKSILNPFAVAYKENKNINSVKFIKKRAKRDNDNIPKYIFYLVDNDKKDELRKVLLYDYFDFYDNDSNMMNKFARIISKGLIYVIVFLSYLFLFAGAILLVRIVFMFFESLPYIQKIEIEFNGIIMKGGLSFLWLIGMDFLFFIFYLVFMLFARFFNIDMYTFKEKRIKGMINHKIRVYDKRINKVVL